MPFCSFYFRHMFFKRTSLFLGVCLLAAALMAPAKSFEKRVDFTKQIKPIFKNDCYDCHTTNHAKGGLDMSTKAGLARGGDTGKLFKAGKSSQSLLIKRLKGQGGPRMPKGENALKEAQIKLISKWIDEGARM